MTNKPLNSISSLKENKEEILKLTSLITNVCSVDIVILFGKYASQTGSVLGGYEFLLLTGDPSEPPVNIPSVSSALKKNFPPAQRKESRLYLYGTTVLFMNQNNTTNYFFYAIRQYGIVVYDNKKFRLYGKRPLRIVKTTRILNMNFEIYFNIAEKFLLHAREDTLLGNYRPAALELALAAKYFFETIDILCIGYAAGAPDMETYYLRARHFSRELHSLFGMNTPGNKNLREINGFYKNIFLRDYTVGAGVIKKCYRAVFRLGNIVKNIYEERMARLEEESSGRSN